MKATRGGDHANRVIVRDESAHVTWLAGIDFGARKNSFFHQQRPNEVEPQISVLLSDSGRLKENITTCRSGAVEVRIAEMEAANQEMAEKLLAMEKRYLQLQSLLDQRTRELQESQIYLKKPDEFPESTVVKKVEAINSQLFNMAMYIVDVFERSLKMELEETFVQEIFIDRCRHIARLAIGNLLYSANCQIDEAILHRLPVNPEDSMPLQLAIQCILVKWAMRVIGIPGEFPGKDEVTDLYKVIRAREPQSVSSQWRVIAYNACPSEESTESALEDIMAVLCISGISSLNADYQFVKKNVRKRVMDIEKSMNSLRKAIHEGVTSSDIELVVVEPDTSYEAGAMVDTVPNTMPSPRPQQVLCTVGLGLKKSTTKQTSDSKGFYLRTDLLKRPEVALVGILDNFMWPMDPSFDGCLSKSN